MPFFFCEARTKTEEKEFLSLLKHKLASKQREKRETPRASSLPRLAKMDDAKENAVVTAAPGKTSWPLPSPSTGGSGGGGVVRRRPFLGDDEKDDDKEKEDETILVRRRRAVDVLAHMATTAAVRDLAAALNQLAGLSTAEDARRAAERALDGEVFTTRTTKDFSRCASRRARQQQAPCLCFRRRFAPIRLGCLRKNLRLGISAIFGCFLRTSEAKQAPDRGKPWGQG